MDFGNAAGQGALYPVNLADGGQGITGTGLEATVQVAGSFATRQMTRDGFASGFLDKLETDSSGKIFGVFTNGFICIYFEGVALSKNCCWKNQQ